MKKLLITAALVAGSLAPVPAATAVAKETPAKQAPVVKEATPDQADQEAALVEQEDRRLIQVRAVTAVAPTKGTNWTKPYRLDTGSGYTLVLTQKTDAYTIGDLLTLAPQTFVRQSDGSPRTSTSTPARSSGSATPAG
jgi:hypothetical protein